MVHIIVTGSRDLGEPKAGMAYIEHYNYMKAQLRQHIEHIESITQGNAKGADSIARHFARNHQIECHDFPADWSQGKSAGPKRNRHMIRETIRRYGIPNIVVLGFVNKPLEQSRGTSNCLQVAGEQGLRTHLFRCDLQTKEW